MRSTAARATLVALVASSAFAAVFLPSHSPDAAAASPNRAAVVVRQSDGTVRDMCVFFDEAEITGYQLLKRSGFDYESEQFVQGHAICKIGPDGCDTSKGEDCFCDSAKSWGYWIRNKGDTSWALSSLGADDRTVRDGYLDGWSWGANGAQPKPPALKFSDVCPAISGTVRPDEDRAPAPTSGGDRPPAAGDTSEPRAREDDDRTSRDDDDPRETSSAEVSLALASSSPESTTGADDQAKSEPVDDSEPVNYLLFAGFAGAFALAGLGAYLMQRRRAR